MRKVGRLDLTTVIGLYRARGRPGKLATDGNRDIVAMRGCITSLSYILRSGHDVGWYEFLKSPEVDCGQWMFSYSNKRCTSQSLGACMA